MKTFSKLPQVHEEYTSVTCPVCGSRECKTHWDCGTYSFQRCTCCKHIYQNPRPRPQDLLDRYDEEYKNYEVENSQNFFQLMIEGLNDVGFLDLEKHIQESLPPLESPKFLDVGCATGVLVRYMYDRGWDSMGLEVCVPAAEYAQANRGVRVQVGTLESQEWQWGTYDLIHSSHVIEHVPDPNEYLSLQHKLLKPGGYIIVTTPNTKSFQAAFMGASWRSAIADHVHLFSRTHLGELLVRAGFEPKEWKTWGGIPLGMAPKGVKRSADWLAKRLGLGDVMIFLAKKPKKSDA